MKELVKNSNRIFHALGSLRVAATETDEKKKEFRRSIVLARAMGKGEIIKSEDIDYKRPGTGFNPGMTKFIIGRKINKDLEYDHILTENDLV